MRQDKYSQLNGGATQISIIKMRLLMIVVLFCGIASGLFHEEPKVLTSLGPISGIYEKSRLGRKYAAFLGVPYAKSPIGRRRFEVRISNYFLKYFIGV